MYAVILSKFYVYFKNIYCIYFLFSNSLAAFITLSSLGRYKSSNVAENGTGVCGGDTILMGPFR